jgi:hypothetical protein
MPGSENHLANGWNEWSRHVLIELKEHRAEILELRNAITALTVEIATMRVKVTAITGIAALVGGGIVTLIARMIAP